LPDSGDIRYPEEFFRELKVKTKSFLVGEVTVGTTETELCVGVSPLTKRIRLRFYVEDSEPIYIGNTGVSIDDYLVLPGRGNEEVFEFDPDTTVNIYAIAAVEGVTVKVREEA